MTTWSGWLARRRSLTVPIALLMMIITAGCGYHFAAEGSALPPQAKTVYVEKFENRTRFTGVDDQFQRYLKDEIADHKRLAIADSPSDADLVLTGEIRYLYSIPGATNAVSEPINTEESVSANASLTDTRTHQIIWTSSNLTANETSPLVSSAVITTSPLFLQQNLRSQDIAKLPNLQLAKTQLTFSRGQMMQQLAQNLYASMTEGF